MSAPEPASSGTFYAVATGVLAFAPFGITLQEWALCSTCYAVGAIARTGLRMAQDIEADRPARVARALAALSASMMIAGFLAMTGLIASKMIGLDADLALGGVLGLAGWSGPDKVQSVVNLFSDVITRRFGSGNP